MDTLMIPTAPPYDPRSPVGAPTLKRLPRAEISYAKTLMTILHVKDDDVRAWLAALGKLTDYPKRPALLATPISQSLFAGWMNGTEIMQRPRLAALVVTLEFLGCLRRYELTLALNDPATTAQEKQQATLYGQLLRAATPTLTKLEGMADIAPYLPLYRQGLNMRLQADAGKSEVDRLRYDLWRQVFGVADRPQKKRKEENA